MEFNLALAFLAGLLTALSPCIYPLIPITLGLIKKEQPKTFIHSFSLSFTYVLGMSTVYTTLAVIFSSFGLVLGSSMQNTYVVFFLGLFFLLMALSLLDVFPIVLPQSLYNAILKFIPTGFLGALFLGAFSGLLAAPCSGPVLAFILGIIAKRQDMEWGVALMISYSLGMGFLFLLLGSFAYLIRFIPRSGPWMNFVKYLLAIGMLSVSFYYMSIIFRDDKNGISKNNWHIISYKNQYADFKALIATAKKNNQPLLIDFYADWCALCQKLDKITFSDHKVQEALKNFMLIKIDLTKSSNELDKIAKDFNITGLPVIILPGQVLYGYLSPTELLLHLRK